MSNTSPLLPIPAVGEAPAADPFLALLAECEAASARLVTCLPVLASLTADLVARSNEHAIATVGSCRSALLARKTRVLGSAKRQSRTQCKRIVADIDAVDVSTEQLRVRAAVAGAGAVYPYLDCTTCTFAATMLLASPRLVSFPAGGVSSSMTISFGGELGSVTTGDGLRVVNAAGPGLKWFEPHSRNEFSLVLAQADGSVPVWLISGDIAVEVLSSGGTAVTRVGAAAVTRTEWVRQGTVSVLYRGVSENTLEVELQLYVCGVPVDNADVDRSWCVLVRRKPLAGHECAAVGTHVRTLDVVGGGKFGMAVSADEKWLVAGSADEGMLSVYSLPEGELVRAFGSEGDGPLQFDGLRRLCFTLNGNLVVVDRDNKRLQEVTLEGVFVRFIGVGEFGYGYGVPVCVAVHDDVIAVGCARGTGPRVALFDLGSGALMSRFGEVGTACGQLSEYCTGIRFTADGSHVIVAEDEAQRQSLFTTAGVFVRCVGVGMLGGWCSDVLQSVSGEYVVADADNHRVCVFSPDGSELIRSWGVLGNGDGQFESPTALAAAGQHLYVMEFGGDRVQVFE